MGQSSTRVLIHAILLATSGCASIAVAQSYSIPEPPMRSTTDANGVDLAKGQFAISETDLSIGPQGAGGLAHTRFWSAQTTGSGWRHSYLLAISNRLNGLTVNLGDHSVAFTGSGSSYTSDQADGSQMSVSGNIYTFTQRDGAVYTFDSSIIVQKATYYGPVLAVATSILKPDGEKITLTYYQDGYDKPIPGDSIYVGLARLQSVTSTTGYQLYYAYASDNPNATDDWYRITQVTAINGALDYCASLANPCATNGARVTYGTTTSGSSTVETVVDPQGRTKVYTTDTASRRMLSVQRPTGGVLTFGYGSDNRIATVSNGTATWNYVWSLSGTTLTGTVTQPLSRQRVVTANSATNSVLTDKDGLGHTTTFGYDNAGRRTSIVAPEGTSILFAYDPRGNITQQTAVAKAGSGLSNISSSSSFDTTCYNLKTCNQPNSTTDALGNVTTFSYDPNHGGVVTVTAPAAPNGVHPQTRFSYSQLSAYYQTNGGLTAGPPIYKLTSTSSCQSAASCAGTSDEVVSTISYGTPGAPNTLVPTSVTKRAGDGSLAATTTSTYDYAGNVITSDGPLPGAADTTLYAYNRDRQVTQITSPDPDGAGPLKPRAVQYGYGPDGQVTSTAVGTANADGSGFAALQTGVTAYDILGRKTQDSLSASGTTFSVTNYSYDSATRLDCVAVRMNPGAFGSLPAACSLSGDGGYGSDRITRYTYDAADEQLRVTTGYGTSLQRDELTNTWSPDGKQLTLADAKGNKTTYTYDGFDRVSKTAYPTPSNGTVSSTSDYEQLTYDAGSRITQRRLRDGLSISYGYDALNRVMSKTLPNGESGVSYTYDNLGHSKTITQGSLYQAFNYDALGRLTGENEAFGSTSLQYDLAGHRTKLTWNDGFYVNYDYDLAGEVTAIRENGATSGLGLLATFTYDDLGRRTIKTYGNGAQQSYSYNGVSQLNGLNSLLANYAGNVLNFSLNPAGQIATRASSNDSYAWTGAYNVARPYTANGLNQYTVSGALSLTYDGRGNLTGDGSTVYAYTSENALKSASGATNATIYYDPTNRMVEYDTSTSTRFLYDGPDLIAEISNPSGAVMRRFVHGPGDDEPLVWYEGADTNTRQWLLADERGSVVAVSNSAGTAITINAYDSYGYPKTGNSGRFQYTGQAWLAELGLYNYKARIYSPTLGRFLQADPIGYQAGPNMYNYTGSDPVNKTDPTGKDPEIVVLAAPYVAPAINAVAIAISSVVTSVFSFFAGIFGGGSPPQPPKNANAKQVQQQQQQQNTNQLRIACSGKAYSLAGNPANIGKEGFPGVTVTKGSAAVIPQQFTGALTGGPKLRAIGASAFGTVTAADGRVQSFKGITQAIGFAKLGSASKVQSMIMARDPGALVIEIVGGQDFGKDASVALNLPNLGEGCPAGTQ